MCLFLKSKGDGNSYEHFYRDRITEFNEDDLPNDGKYYKVLASKDGRYFSPYFTIGGVGLIANTETSDDGELRGEALDTKKYLNDPLYEFKLGEEKVSNRSNPKLTEWEKVNGTVYRGIHVISKLSIAQEFVTMFKHYIRISNDTKGLEPVAVEFSAKFEDLVAVGSGHEYVFHKVTPLYPLNII